ncbi:hypothetical protein E2I00_003236 [Balaenoptera physalus]|uniref:Chemokine interleukin-8-like domain-containing protein n=1 Tax=Balaenoptera physalus TaxID=9770 RepID=A0A6A1Q366_BALPH|nr:hypothetical protein E2I00_003236 [Balaenoptera physalus]
MRLLILAFFGICCLAAYTVEDHSLFYLQHSNIHSINNCILFLFAWFSLPGVGSEVPDKTICVSLTTQRLPIKKLKTYTIKEGFMKAVIFITRRGLKVCADPQVEWVKKAVQTIDKSSRRNVSQTKPTEAQQSNNTAVTLTA